LGEDDIELEERFAQLARTQRLIVVLGEEELPDGNLATRYRFAHALYRDVLYSDLVTKRRILLHRKAGELLARHYGKESSRIAAQLAMHFERGRDFKRAIEHLIFAGDNAARLYASRESAEHFSRALDLLDRLTDEGLSETKLALYQKRGQARAALGRFQQAVEDYTEMLKQARALGSLEKESAALNALSMTLFYSHRLDEITARADEIIEAAERAGSDALRVEAMQVIALKHLGYGELTEAKPMLDEIIRTARAIDHKSVLLVGLAWRGILHFFHTEYDEAERMVKETRSLARELRDGFLLLESYFVTGMVLGNKGRMTEALQTFEEGMEIAARNGDEFWSPRMPNCVGWIYRELQDFENAVKYDQKGLDAGRKQGVLEAQANSLINLGIDYSRAGERARSPEAFNEVENIFKRDSWFRWRYNIRLQAGKCEHWLKEGNLEKAEKYASRLLETATHYEARKYIAVAHKLVAQIAVARGDNELAEKELNVAAAQLKTHPVPIIEWKVQAALGRLLSQKGDEAGAREAFNRAASIINDIAAHVKDEQVKETFLISEAVQEVLAQAEIKRSA
jgi:tetratricopeptide (TPR) repeat protein